jgi:hypothetical protein
MTDSTMTAKQVSASVRKTLDQLARSGHIA